MKTPAEYRNMEFANLLIEFAKLLKPKVYVELGVRKGYTLAKMVPFVGKAIGVDPAPLVENVPGAILVKQMSLAYAATLKGESIDFLFVDADHHCEAVINDVLAFLPFIKTGTGMIFLHDTHPIIPELATDGYCYDAWRAAAVIHDGIGPNLEIVTIPGPWAGLSILRKRGPHHLAWADQAFGEPVITETSKEENHDGGSENNVSGEIFCPQDETIMASNDSLSTDQKDHQSSKRDRRRLRNR